MKSSSSGEQILSYYEYGIYTADIIFTPGRIIHRRRDLYSNQWTSFNDLNENEDSYKMPLKKIWSMYKEFHSIDWNKSNDIYLHSGQHYQRYLKIEHPTKEAKKEAWIFALQAEKMPVDLVVIDNRVVGFIRTTRDGCIILVQPGYEKLTPLKYWQNPSLSQPEHIVKHLGEFSVITGDGVKLSTEVWIPADLKEEEKVPAILVRTPYGRLNFSEVELRFVQRGYALVSQDTRGREDSEGEWVPFNYEMDDGNDTLNWIANQPWSDGNVGMIGASYGGYVQWAAAAQGNPHLKAIVSLVTAGSPFVDLPRKGGAMMSGTLAWAFMMADRRINTGALSRDDWDEVLNIRPIKDIPLKTLGNEVHFWNEWMKHPDNDEFWKKADWSLYGKNIDVPSLIISGWYDDDGAGTTQAWEMLQNHRRKNQRLILGPWYHQANSTRQIHNIQFGNNALRYDLDLLYLRWFDRFLKNIPNGVEKEEAVEYYMVGENQWKTSPNWPPAEVEYITFYLGSNGSAKTSSGNGYLQKEPIECQGHDDYIFDPKDPTPYLIDMSENECSVPENYRDVETREDVLVYTSPVLQENMAIAGDIYAVLYASSSAKDTDWVIRLTDVDEEGNSIRLADGIIRARYRHSLEAPTPLEPGKIEKYEIKMSKIANLFKKGHRIRIQVTSGAKNLVFPNHNTGHDPAEDTKMVIASQKIYYGHHYPTHVQLPIIPNK